MNDGAHPGIAAREMELLNHFKIKAQDDPDGHGDDNDKSDHLLFDLIDWTRKKPSDVVLAPAAKVQAPTKITEQSKVKPVISKSEASKSAKATAPKTGTNSTPTKT